MLAAMYIAGTQLLWGFFFLSKLWSCIPWLKTLTGLPLYTDKSNSSVWYPKTSTTWLQPSFPALSFAKHHHPLAPHANFTPPTTLLATSDHIQHFPTSVLCPISAKNTFFSSSMSAKTWDPSKLSSNPIFYKKTSTVLPVGIYFSFSYTFMLFCLGLFSYSLLISRDHILFSN